MDFKVTKSGVPILKKEEIEVCATKVLSDYDITLLHEPRAVPIEDIIETYLKLDVDYKTLDKDGSILGMTVFNNGYLDVYNQDLENDERIKISKGTILIDNSLVEDNKHLHRFRFTCSHEASHWILHRGRFDREIEGQMNFLDEYSQSNAVKCLNRNVENAFGYKEVGFRCDEDWLEWQADYMGAALLIPKYPLVKEFIKMLNVLGIKEPYLYLDDQPCNIRNYELVIGRLVNVFNVSKKAVHIRLAKLNLLRGEDKQLFFT